MALPPIVTNSSLYKVISGAQDKPQKVSGKADATALTNPKDTVELSPAAVEKLKASGVDTAEKAQKVAGDIRNTLAQNPGLTLSGDPAAL